jgi:alkylation response protein AidB-like acyl-CoA dehydrogenase
MIAAHAAETLRRPADAVWSALRSSGFFYQLVPKAFGGMATDFDSFMDATLAIAEACASTGWTASFCAKHNWLLAHFPRETQAELWGGAYPYIIAPSLGVPMGRLARAPGGFRITGHYRYGTGIMHADWVLAVAMLNEGDTPTILFCLLPADTVVIHDTWHADGMAGTGSHDVRLTDVFVPEMRTIPAGPLLIGRGPGSRTYAQEIYSIPLVLFMGVTGAVPALGAARGALRLYREHITGHVQHGPGPSKTAPYEKPAVQIRLAEADLLVETAGLTIRDAARRAVAAGQASGSDQVPLRIVVRARCAHALRLCRKAMDLITEGAGSGIHRLDHPLQRALRDFNVVASHVGYDVDSAYELHGRTLLALAPNSMLF